MDGLLIFPRLQGFPADGRSSSHTRPFRSFRRFSLLVLVAAWALSAAAPAGAAQPSEGKFHLVYLVSTDKVEVGAKAYVEPLFLTDGADIKPVYEYCQALHQGVKNPPQRPIVDRERALERFCQNEAFTLAGKNFFVRSIEGITVKLADIAFTQYRTSDTTMLAPFLSNTGTAQIASVVEGTRKTTLKLSEWRHFLMAANDDLLRSLIPSVTYQPAEYEQLLKRARAFAEQKKGWLPAEGARKTPHRMRGFEDRQTDLTDLIVADIDGDRKPDMVVGARATAVFENKERDTVWAGIGFVFANGNEAMLSNVYSTINYWHATKYGAIPSAPLAVIRTESCSYVVYRPSEFYGAIDFRAFGKPSDTCRDKQVMKVYEAAMKHD